MANQFSTSHKLSEGKRNLFELIHFEVIKWWIMYQSYTTSKCVGISLIHSKHWNRTFSVFSLAIFQKRANKKTSFSQYENWHKIGIEQFSLRIFMSNSFANRKKKRANNSHSLKKKNTSTRKKIVAENVSQIFEHKVISFQFRTTIISPFCWIQHSFYRMNIDFHLHKTVSESFSIHEN